MKKKLISALLATTMIAGTLVGCGGGNDDSSKDKETAKTEDGKKDEGSSEGTKYPRNEEGYPDLGGETFTIWFNMLDMNAQVTADMGEYEVIKEWEKKLNCNLEFVSPPVGQAQDNFAIMMADEKLPDMIFCGGIDGYYPGGVEMAYEDGVLYDYTHLINEENTPNFWKIMNENEIMKKSAMDDEGRIVYLGAKICGSPESDLDYVGPMIRKDYLEATGLDVPETIDDWTEMFAAMKANGVKYPLAVCGKNWFDPLLNSRIFPGAYGLNGKDFFIGEDGKVKYSPYEDAYKDLLAQAKEWYDAGYINPDFSTQGEQDVMALCASGEVGSIGMHLWTYASTYYQTVGKDDPSKEFICVPCPVLNEGDELPAFRPSNQSLADKKYITADAENPEACVALLDTLYLEEVNKAMSWGTEGVTYENAENGLVKSIPLDADAPAETKLKGSPQQMHAFENDDLEQILINLPFEEFKNGLMLWKDQSSDQLLPNALMHTPEESEFIGTYRTDITTYVEEMTLKFVMGKESLDKFEEYQQTLKDMKVEEWIAVKQAAVDRYNNR